MKNALATMTRRLSRPNIPFCLDLFVEPEEVSWWMASVMVFWDEVGVDFFAFLGVAWEAPLEGVGGSVGAALESVLLSAISGSEGSI